MLRQLLTAAELSELGLDVATDELPAPPEVLRFGSFLKTRTFLVARFLFFWTTIGICIHKYLHSTLVIPHHLIYLIYCISLTLLMIWEVAVGLQLAKGSCAGWDLCAVVGGVLCQSTIFADCLFVVLAYKVGYYITSYLSLALCILTYVMLIGIQQIRMLLALGSSADTYTIERIVEIPNVDVLRFWESPIHSIRSTIDIESTSSLSTSFVASEASTSILQPSTTSVIPPMSIRHHSTPSRHHSYSLVNLSPQTFIAIPFRITWNSFSLFCRRWSSTLSQRRYQSISFDYLHSDNRVLFDRQYPNPVPLSATGERSSRKSPSPNHASRSRWYPPWLRPGCPNPSHESLEMSTAYKYSYKSTTLSDSPERTPSDSNSIETVITNAIVTDSQSLVEEKRILSPSEPFFQSHSPHTKQRNCFENGSLPGTFETTTRIDPNESDPNESHQIKSEIISILNPNTSHHTTEILDPSGLPPPRAHPSIYFPSYCFTVHFFYLITNVPKVFFLFFRLLNSTLGCIRRCFLRCRFSSIFQRPNIDPNLASSRNITSTAESYFVAAPQLNSEPITLLEPLAMGSTPTPISSESPTLPVTDRGDATVSRNSTNNRHRIPGDGNLRRLSEISPKDLKDIWLSNYKHQQRSVDVVHDKIIQLINTTQLLDCLYLQNVLRMKYLPPDCLEVHEFSSAFNTVGRCFLQDIFLCLLKAYLLASWKADPFLLCTLILSSIQSIYMCFYNTLDEDIWQDILTLE